MAKKVFDVGDIVRLKSGGPRMTVETVLEPDIQDILNRENRGNTYHCQWFAGSKLQIGEFTEHSIEAAPNETTPKPRK